MALCGICFLLIASCQSKKKGTFTVSGTFKNADKLAAVEGPVSKVYLLEVTYGKDQAPIVLDSAKIPVSNGNFTLSGPTRTQEIFELVFGSNVIAVPLINDAPEIRVNVDLGKKDDFYEVHGSDASNQLKDLITIFGKKNFEVERAMADADSLKQASAPDSLQRFASTQKRCGHPGPEYLSQTIYQYQRQPYHLRPGPELVLPQLFQGRVRGLPDRPVEKIPR